MAMRKNHEMTGASRTKEYRAWHDMKRRCLNPKNRFFAQYAGRGITVCERWLSVRAFLADMGPAPSQSHSLDRINNDLGYEPGNCRWATVAEQQRNRSNNRILSLGNRAMTATEWSEETGIPLATILARLRYGWHVKDVLTRPIDTKKHRKIDIERRTAQ